MKLTTFLLIIALFQANAKGFSQVTLHAKNAPLEKVLNSIEKQSGYTFLVDINNVKVDGITVDVTNASVEETLKACFKNLPINYKIVKNNVFITRAEPIALDNLKIELPPPIIIIGHVTNKNGEPLPGVSILVKGTNKGVITDRDGNYKFSINSSDKILVFSCIGMEKQEIEPGEKTVVNVIMKEDASILNEIVVQGYGLERKRDLIGNITKVSSKEIERRPVGNILSALQGMVPGLEIVNSTGTPGASVQIRLRGINTPNSTTSSIVALVLVDGVPVNDLSYLSTADIESTEVLKDASATAIYGSRGAGGVILITTKKGKRGSGPGRFSFTAYTSLDQPTNTAKMLTTAQYNMIRREGYKNDGIAVTSNLAPDLYMDSTVNTNWSKALYKNALAHDYQANFSGGSQTINYYISGGYRNEDAIVTGDWYQKRANARIGLDANLSSKLVVGGGASFSSTKSNLYNSSLASFIYYAIPKIPSTTATGNQNLTAYPSPFLNPNRQLTAFTNTLSNQFLGNFYFNYNIWKQLYFRTDINYQMVSGNSTAFSPTTVATYSTTSTASFPSGTYGFTNNNGLTVEPQLNYTISINKHTFKLLAGGSLINNTSKYATITMTGYSNNILSTLGSASTFSAKTYSESPYKFASAFGRLSYKYDKKYLVEGVFRRDGSSRFGSNFQYGNFWSVGTGWVFSEENFVQSLLGKDFFGKLKVTYGITGNDNIGDFQYESYSSTGSYGGNPASYLGNLANSYLKWEQTSKLDIGLDFSMFGDRLNVTADYFRHRTTGPLFNKALSVVTGFTSMSANLDGVVDNNGFDLALTVEPIRTKSFRWTSQFNFSTLKNKLVSLPGLANLSNVYKYQFRIGQPLALNWGYKYLGVDPTTGLAKFEDVDKSGTIALFTPDYQVLGKSIPDFYGGWNNTFSYKQFELNISSQFVSGIQKSYTTYTSFIGDKYNLPVEVLNRWQATGDITDIPRSAAPGTAAATNNSKIVSSSFAFCDASYFRVKNIVLSYTFKTPEKLKINNLKLFVSGYNLFTITDYKGNDPENGASLVPVTKMYTIGLNISL